MGVRPRSRRAACREELCVRLGYCGGDGRWLTPSGLDAEKADAVRHRPSPRCGSCRGRARPGHDDPRQRAQITGHRRRLAVVPKGAGSAPVCLAYSGTAVACQRAPSFSSPRRTSGVTFLVGATGLAPAKTEKRRKTTPALGPARSRRSGDDVTAPPPAVGIQAAPYDGGNQSEDGTPPGVFESDKTPRTVCVWKMYRCPWSAPGFGGPP